MKRVDNNIKIHFNEKLDIGDEKIPAWEFYNTIPEEFEYFNLHIGKRKEYSVGMLVFTFIQDTLEKDKWYFTEIYKITSLEAFKNDITEKYPVLEDGVYPHDLVMKFEKPIIVKYKKKGTQPRVLLATLLHKNMEISTM